jgi:site-specific DNA recombinase
MDVALYLRISEDRDGRQTATERQREDCMRYARQREWNVVAEFEDVDLSAWKRAVKRPAFEEMLRRTAAGEFDVVLAWKFDRVLRSVRDFARLIDTADDGDAFLVDMHGVDTSTPTGKMQAGMMAVFAEAESKNISLRVTRKHEESARRGLPQTGGHRLFGYSRDRLTVDEEEAALIREAVQRLTDGESLRGVCYDWEQRGVKTTAGRPWRPTTLKRLLTSPALAGVREHHGQRHQGVWPAIISLDEQRRLAALLDNRQTTNVTARRHLLTGIATCGICEHSLVARPWKRKARYLCARRPGTEHCGKIARQAAPVDEMVVEGILIRLEHATFPTDVPDDTPILKLIEEDEVGLLELSRDYYQEKVISRAEYFANRDALRARIAGHRAQLTQGRGMVEQFIGAPDELRRAWASRGLEWRRSLVMACIDRVVILPDGKGGRKPFRPELVKIEWKF